MYATFMWHLSEEATSSNGDHCFFWKISIISETILESTSPTKGSKNAILNAESKIVFKFKFESAVKYSADLE